MATPSLPASYEALPFQHIRVYHHPRGAPAPTPVVILELHRPDAANAFTVQMRNDVVAAYELFDADDRVKAVVLSGHGKVFCAGADLNVGFQKEIEGRKISHHRDGGGHAVLAIHRSLKPTIAAVGGSAVGVGFTIQLPCVARVVSRRAKMGAVFARRGISADACSSFFLPRLIGYSRAIFLTSTGGVFPATSPHFGDLFNEIVDPELVLPRALELAEDMVQNVSAVASKVIRDEMWRGPASAEEAHLLESKFLIESFRSADHEEGKLSFFEKRPPRFEDSMRKNPPQTWPFWTDVNIEGPLEKEAKAKSKL